MIVVVVVVITSFHSDHLRQTWEKAQRIQDSFGRLAGETFSPIDQPRRKHQKPAQSYRKQSDSDGVGADPPGCAGAKAQRLRYILAVFL